MNSQTLPSIVTMLLLLVAIGGCAPILWSLRVSSDLEWNGNDRIELPLIQDRAGHVGVPARVQGVDVLALLDTGAGVPMINPATASAIGGAGDDSVVKNVSVQLGPTSLTLPIVPVSEGIGSAQLVLGAELFAQAVVDIDFNKGRVTLIHPRMFNPPEEEPLLVDLSYGRPIAEIAVNGKKPAICALVDTGSFFGVSFSPKVVERLSLPQVPNQTTRYRRVDGKLQETPVLAPLAELRIGNWMLDNVPANALAPDHNPPCGSVVGMAALSRFRSILDIGSRRIWLLQR